MDVAALDPRTPVIIGVGQHNQRVDDGDERLEPVELMAIAARTALADAGGDTPVPASVIDSVRTVALLSWRYRNPGALLAERLDIGHPVDSAVTPMGGNSPQSLVNATALDIAAGDADCVLLSGAEAWRSRNAAKAGDVDQAWTSEPDDAEAARVLGDEVELNHPAEVALQIFLPVHLYPLFENAWRHHQGWDADTQRAVLGDLWSRFSEVAAKNPNAWIQQARTPEEITTPSAGNRMIAKPYTKVMCANNAVEQSAALLMCSVEKAREMGIAEGRWVFPLAGSDAHEHPAVSHRAELYAAPAVGVAGRAALSAAGKTIDDIDHVDLYSCFPIAVQVGADELGLDLDRQLTLTGGLSFAGGPWNNYVMHSIATMVEQLRNDPGSTGLVWGNGGYLTKHAFGVYSTEPTADPFTHVHPQDEIDALPRRELSTDYEGTAPIESAVVTFDADNQPDTAIAALRLDDGRRAWATSTDPEVVAALGTDDDHVGRTAHRTAEGTLTLP